MLNAEGAVEGEALHFPVELAETKIARTVEQQKLLIEEHSASFRWLMASLLAINGGGLVALSALKLAASHMNLAGSTFAFGVVSALAVGWLGQKVNAQGYKIASEIELFWRLAIVNGSFDAVESDALDKKMAAIPAWPARLAGSFSLLAWLLGLITIGAVH